MWRGLVGLVLLCGAAASAHAQVAYRYVGFTGGGTYSDLANWNVSNEHRWGGTAGLMLGTTTFDYSFVELSPAWTQMGGGDFRIDYIDIPLLVGGLMPIGGRDMIFRLYGGIGFAFKISCSEEVLCETVQGDMWTLPIGLSFMKAAGTGKFFGLDARYAIGLSDTFEVGEMTNRSWQFRAFFGLPLGGR
jgi:hypothetical protein